MHLEIVGRLRTFIDIFAYVDGVVKYLRRLRNGTMRRGNSIEASAPYSYEFMLPPAPLTFPPCSHS